jgi:hypothetical protein
MHAATKGPALMRFLIITALLLFAGGLDVFAEIPVQPRPSADSALPAQKATDKSAHESAVANCVEMWDRGTHMTKQQWLRTCRRVQDRLQNLQIK